MVSQFQQGITQQIMYFCGGDCALVYEGAKFLNDYRKDGSLFKYPSVRSCIAMIGNPPALCRLQVSGHKFMTVSMDVSSEASYVYALDVTRPSAWEDFAPHENTPMERWSGVESKPEGF